MAWSLKRWKFRSQHTKTIAKPKTKTFAILSSKSWSTCALHIKFGSFWLYRKIIFSYSRKMFGCPSIARSILMINNQNKSFMDSELEFDHQLNHYCKFTNVILNSESFPFFVQYSECFSPVRIWISNKDLAIFIWFWLRTSCQTLDFVSSSNRFNV